MSYRVGPPPPPWQRLLIVDFVASAAGAGVLLVAAVLFLAGGDRWPFNVASWIGAPLLGVSLLVLVIDLGRPARFWRMLANFNSRSAMSWGAWILNAFFLVAALGFGTNVLVQLGWTARIESVQVVQGYLGALLGLAPLVLGYKGVLLSTTAVAPWRSGRVFGALFVADGIGLGASLLALLIAHWPLLDPAHTGALPDLWRVVRGAGAARALLMVAQWVLGGADRPLLARGLPGVGLGLSVLCSLGSVAGGTAGAALGAVSSLLLRAGLLRAPYVASPEPRPESSLAPGAQSQP